MKAKEIILTNRADVIETIINLLDKTENQRIEFSEPIKFNFDFTDEDGEIDTAIYRGIAMGWDEQLYDETKSGLYIETTSGQKLPMKQVWVASLIRICEHLA